MVLALPPLPRPAAFDFGLQREAQEGSDQDDYGEEAYARQGQGRGDGTDDVGADQQFEAQEDASAEVGPVAVVAGAPVAVFHALAEEAQACEQDSGEDDEDAGHFEELGEVLDEGVELGHGALATCGNAGVFRRVDPERWGRV